MRLAHSPHPVYGQNDHQASQWSDARKFSEDDEGTVASVPQGLIKIEQYSRSLITEYTRLPPPFLNRDIRKLPIKAPEPNAIACQNRNNSLQ
jgi:hypothetical protein